jgi:hypothetical protein
MYSVNSITHIIGNICERLELSIKDLSWDMSTMLDRFIVRVIRE